MSNDWPFLHHFSCKVCDSYLGVTLTHWRWRASRLDLYLAPWELFWQLTLGPCRRLSNGALNTNNLDITRT
jgi:hypothetical protein